MATAQSHELAEFLDVVSYAKYVAIEWAKTDRKMNSTMQGKVDAATAAVAESAMYMNQELVDTRRDSPESA